MLYVNYITIKLEMLETGQATHSSILGLPLWLSWLRICLQSRRPGFNSWVGKIPWRRERLPTPVYWSGEFHGLYSSWGAKSQTQLSDFHSLTQSWKWVSLEAQVVKNLPATLETQGPGFNPWVGKIPWRREWQPTPVFLPGKSHGQRSLMDYNPWDHKNLDTIEHLTHKQTKLEKYSNNQNNKNHSV